MRIASLAIGMSFALACSEDPATGACGEVPELVMKFEPGQIAASNRPYQTGEQVTLITSAASTGAPPSFWSRTSTTSGRPSWPTAAW